MASMSGMSELAAFPQSLIALPSFSSTISLFPSVTLLARSPDASRCMPDAALYSALFKEYTVRLNMFSLFFLFVCHVLFV